MMMNVRLDDRSVSALRILAKKTDAGNASQTVRRAIGHHISRNQAGVVRQLIADQVSAHDLTFAVTISFVPDRNSSLASDVEANRIRLPIQYLNVKQRRKALASHECLSLPLYEPDAAIGEQMIRAYFNRIRKALSPTSSLPAIGVRETVKRSGVDNTHLHFHCLMMVPAGRESQFQAASKEFWYDKGYNRFGAPIACHIEPLRSKEATLAYALKNVGEDYPIDRIIMVGFHNS